jgi:hypothetical protein
VAAKGGRERIVNINNILITDKNSQSVSLTVLPDKIWNWSNDAKPIGLSVATEDFSKGIGYRIQDDSHPFSYKLTNVKMEWHLAGMLDSLLETKSIKPTILGRTI